MLLFACSLTETIIDPRHFQAPASTDSIASEAIVESERPNGSALARILDRGELRVVTREAPSVYSRDRRGRPTGPEYELANAFAESLGVRVSFVVKSSEVDVYRALADGEGDIAAAGLAIALDRKHEFHFSSPLATTIQQVICRRGGPTPRDAADLQRVNLDVRDDIRSLTTLWVLQSRYRKLQWTEQESTPEELLAKVWRRETDCTLADAHIVSAVQRSMPELTVMFTIGEETPLAWAVPRDHTDLLQAINQWASGETGQAAIAAVNYRYYEQAGRFDYVDARILIRRLQQRYPRYRSLIVRAADEFDLDSELLAALSYQESHWDPRAKSPTGVRGMMMLTRKTARALGVSDRSDPEQAIPAGARYLAMLRESISDAIPEPDRTYMTLAAYNMGRARLHAAQRLAREQGRNPDHWVELRDSLMQLCSERQSSCKGYRYDLGREAVRYVERIHRYQNIIAANSIAQEPMLLTLNDQ